MCSQSAFFYFSNVEVFATHIAGLPVAVNINCHATRHSEIIL